MVLIHQGEMRCQAASRPRPRRRISPVSRNAGRYRRTRILAIDSRALRYGRIGVSAIPAVIGEGLKPQKVR